MRRKLKLSAPLIACAMLAAESRQCQAAIYELTAQDRGQYSGLGTGFHSTENTSYVAGTNFENLEFRNFFVFDLSSIAGGRGGGQTIVSAELRIRFSRYTSMDETETYTLFDVTTPIDELVAGGFNASAMDDLGSGIEYGEFIGSESLEGEMISIPLNADALSSLNMTGGLWAIGGAITTLDGDSMTVERMFTASDTKFVPWSETQLVIETIAAPGGLAPLSIACAIHPRRRYLRS